MPEEQLSAEDRVVEFDEDFAQITSESNDAVLAAINGTKFPHTLKAMASLLAAADSIKLGIIEAARHSNVYSGAILYRSLIEHFVRFQYLLFEWMDKQSDEAGKEYELYSLISEELEMANAWKLVGKLKGEPIDKEPLEIMKSHDLVPNDLTARKLNQITTQWKYRSVIRSLVDKFASEKADGGEILINMIPAYGELSSFVHGGKTAERLTTRLMDEGGEEEHAWHYAQWGCILANSMKPHFLLLLAKDNPDLLQHLARQHQRMKQYLDTGI